MQYGVCTSLRSGSTYLEELLHLNALGRPGEQLLHYHGPFETQHMQDFLKTLRAQTPDHVPFGMKLTQAADERWRNIFQPQKLIWLRRRDLMAQAISLYVARTTRQFRLRAGDTPAPEVAFDRKQIRYRYHLLGTELGYWRGRLSEFHGPKMTVWYEDLCESPVNTIWEIATFLETPRAVSDIRTDVNLRIQRDPERNREWIARMKESVDVDAKAAEEVKLPEQPGSEQAPAA